MDSLKLPRPRTWMRRWVNILGRGWRLSSHCHDQMPTPCLRNDIPSENCLTVKNMPRLLTRGVTGAGGRPVLFDEGNAG